MPRLIHLNGMPGVGKSTLAARYVADHPGVLNLDIDRLRPLIGGEFESAGEPARVLALAMVRAHLQAGHDVVLPQLLAHVDQVARFEEAAADGDGSFVEVLVVDDRGQAVDRFYRRDGDDRWHDTVKQLVERAGGRAALASYERELRIVADQRPAVRILSSREGEVDATYTDLLRMIDGEAVRG